mgnify:FL=1
MLDTFRPDKRVFNILVIIILTLITYSWTFWIFHMEIDYSFVFVVIGIRIVASIVVLQDYSLSWSKATQKTFLLKSMVYVAAFCVYAPLYYGHFYLYFMLSELFVYLFAINAAMYGYHYMIHRRKTAKDKTLVIYGAGKAGLKLAEEYRSSSFDLKYFIDDDRALQTRSVDNVRILSKEMFTKKTANKAYDLLIIAMPSVSLGIIQEALKTLQPFFKEIKILPSLEKILDVNFLSRDLRDVTVEELLARNPKDLDSALISSFIASKVVMVSGAGGSIGSEIVRQCLKYKAAKIILIDHSEYNLYQLLEELKDDRLIPVMQSVLNYDMLEATFKAFKPDIFIHAAAYKHVPLVESNPKEGMINNILGTKHCIDLSIEYGVKKFILISTDKAVRPTSIMGATKRVCELYAQNVDAKETHIVAVRFGNVLGSSGSVIPKFKAQIAKGGPVTVTHPEMTRYFMLICEACELVLQAGAIGQSGELFILDMGQPVKIVDLAQKMIELSGKQAIEIVFTGLRPGEKLYEELLIHESDKKTEYESIMVAHKTLYPIDTLEQDIDELLKTKEPVAKLKEMIPEFHHRIKG